MGVKIYTLYLQSHFIFSQNAIGCVIESKLTLNGIFLTESKLTWDVLNLTESKFHITHCSKILGNGICHQSYISKIKIKRS